MIDLGKEKVPVSCPSCKRKHSATLNDVSRGKVIKCSCGTNIQLSDQSGSVKRGVSDINKAFKKLDETFKKFGK